ncbi:MAG TPA: HAMP domain-containing sensor histidine kinase [Plantibacter sp.]|uniref:sensor histidine kinase n=1 Tax=unclassified Plantibacter TaxID=2624265 RepID=UPI002CD26AAD|nr:HAMP domain-containing sensor histidine kinase [Plantibacter sp.]
MLAGVYLFMRYVPTYAISAQTVDADVDAAFVPDWSDTQPTSEMSEGFSLPLSERAALIVSDESDILNALLAASIVILLLLGGCSAIAGWIISGRVLRPLRDISAAASCAARGAFDHRVALVGPRDEITELSATFDHMLEQLGAAFHAHQRFAANASHELRTPLATTKTILEVVTRDQRLDPPMQEAMERLRETNTRSIETVEALLDLADLSQASLRVQPCDLAAATCAVLADFQHAAAARGITISAQLSTATVHGDPRLLNQLLTNLLQNAVRHNVDGGSVSVRTMHAREAEAWGATLVIVNTGAVVSEANLTRLTEPFYRDRGRIAAGEHRSRGLGLAIAEAIVGVHHGRMCLTAADSGGLTVSVSFPAHPTTQQAGTA